MFRAEKFAMDRKKLLDEGGGLFLDTGGGARSVAKEGGRCISSGAAEPL